MKFNQSIIYGIAFSVLITACSSNPQKNTLDNSETTKEQAVLQALKNDPDNPMSLGAAGDFYRTQYDITKNKKDAEKAIKYYKAFKEMQPNNSNVDLFLYSLYYTLHFDGEERNLNRLINAFNEVSDIQQPYVNPPELSEAYYIIQNQDDNLDYDQIENLLLKGVKRSPKSTETYLLLNSLYLDKQQYTIAIALLKQAVKQQPENSLLLTYLADSYKQREQQKDCSFNGKGWKNAISYYEQAKKIDPKNAELRSNLRFAYFAVNNKHLGLSEANRAYQIKKDENSHYNLITAYIMTGKYDKALDLLNHHPELTKNFTAEDNAELYIRSGDWGKATHYFKQSNFKSDYKYLTQSYLQASIASGVNNNDWKPAIDIGKLPKTQWQKELSAFWTGKISDTNLIDRASNSCQAIEAYTYAGYKKIEEKNYTQAKSYLQKATEQALPLFIEDSIAHHLLTLINDK